MARAGDRSFAPAGYAACARAYAGDLCSAAILLVAASLLVGRVWRFPFDDEIYTLTVIGRQSARTLVTDFPASQDVHPPLSYLLFYTLRQVGLSDAGLRLCSLAMTVLAFLLFQLLALILIVQRDGGAPSAASRLIAVMLFGLSPLAVSQGDALRWYPLFALLIALFATLYVACRSDAARLCSGVVLGLAASTNLLAALVATALIIYRYGLQRRFRWSFDLGFWTLMALAAAPAIYSAFWLFTHRLGSVDAQFAGAIYAVPIDLLGFFGGQTLGLSQCWVVVPTVAIFVVAAYFAVDRRQPNDPAHLLLLMFAAVIPLALGGFAKPRSFLYLAPVAALLLTLFFDQQLQRGRVGGALALVALVVAASISAIANINFGTHPSKRETVIPYHDIIEFINGNAKGSLLVISTDPVIPWVLKAGSGDLCTGYFLSAKSCLVSGRHYDSIFVISGHSDKSANETTMRNFSNLVAEVTDGRSKLATFGAGLDQDAALKTGLTGVVLDKNILTVDYYR